MCRFFSFVVAKTGDIFYLNLKQRMEMDKSKYHDSPDSHAFICSYHKLEEDKVNKYEYQKELKEDNIIFKVNKTLQSKIDYFVKNLNLKEFVHDSKSAYEYCYNIKDRPVIRKLITNSYYAYWYCRDIKDRPEIRKLITDSNDAYLYCGLVKDDPAIRKLITDSYYAYRYCRDIKDDPKIRKQITDSGWAYRYCLDIKDDPEMRKLIEK